MEVVNSALKFFLAVLAFLAFIMILKYCESYRMDTSNPKAIIKKVRIGENSEEEIWQVSTYELSDVKIDTVAKRKKESVLP